MDLITFEIPYMHLTQYKSIGTTLLSNKSRGQWQVLTLKKIVGKPGHELGTVLPKHVAMLMWGGGGSHPTRKSYTHMVQCGPERFLMLT